MNVVLSPKTTDSIPVRDFSGVFATGTSFSFFFNAACVLYFVSPST